MKDQIVKYVFLAFTLFLAGIDQAAAVSVTEVKSPGGITAYFAEDHTTPVVGISVSFIGGTAFDPVDKQGLSTLGTSLLNEGAGDMDSFAFQSAMEDRAITFQAGASRDEISVTFLTTTPNLDEAVRLARLAYTQPRFDPDAIERMRQEILVTLKSRAEVPSHLAGRRLAQDLFGDHPYARDEDGEPETVEKLTRADVQEWMKTRLTRDRLVVGVAGDITKERLGLVLDQMFGGLPATSPLPATLPQAKASTKPVADRIVRDLTQATITIGTPGIARNDPEWYAAVLADYIFGSGSFSSRLMNEVREKRGLAYTVRSQLAPLDYGPIMVVSAGTRADQAEQSLAVIREEWAKMVDPGPTEDELQGAKKYLTGAWPLRFTSTGRIADILVAIQRDNLGLDYVDRRNSLIESVTLNDVRRVAKRLYKPDNLTVVIVGPAKRTAAKTPAKGSDKK
jgi:zinc protease